MQLIAIFFLDTYLNRISFWFSFVDLTPPQKIFLNAELGGNEKSYCSHKSKQFKINCNHKFHGLRNEGIFVLSAAHKISAFINFLALKVMIKNEAKKAQNFNFLIFSLSHLVIEDRFKGRR